MDVCCAEMVMMTSRSSQLLREINNDLDQAGVNAVDDALQDARSAVSELQDQVNSIDRQTRIVNDIRWVLVSTFLIPPGTLRPQFSAPSL